jgi:hypothetical protein
MRQVVLNIPENKYNTFIRLIRSLDYVSIPKPAVTKTKGLADKYRAKIPKEVGLEMHKQLDAMRNEWERDI